MARSEEKILSIARKSLEMPPDFGYRGSTPLGKTWGFSPFSVNRDSDALERSNYRRISEDLMAEFPREFRDERMNHWAVGWIDHLLVRVLDREGHVTAAFRKAMEIQDKLDDYPVYDEDDFSAVEDEESLQSLAHSWRFDANTDLRLALKEALPDHSGDEIIGELIDALEEAQIQWGEGYGRYPTEEEWGRAVLARWPEVWEAWNLTATDWWSVFADALLHIEVVDLSREDNREKLARHLLEALDANGLEDFPLHEMEYLLSDHQIRHLTTRSGEDRDKISKFLKNAIEDRLGA